MLHKVEENTDWKSKYQDALKDLELREHEWTQIEELLRNTIARVSAAGRGLENFILKVAEQLGEVSQVISQDHKDHESSHQDAQSLHSFVQEGMELIEKNFQSPNW